MARQIEDGEGNSYVSGTAVKISSSSRCNSSSDLTLANSSSVWAGSQDATRRWLRARATFARLRMTSDSVFESDMLGGVGVPRCIVEGGGPLCLVSTGGWSQDLVCLTNDDWWFGRIACAAVSREETRWRREFGILPWFPAPWWFGRGFGRIATRRGRILPGTWADPACS